MCVGGVRVKQGEMAGKEGKKTGEILNEKIKLNKNFKTFCQCLLIRILTIMFIVFLFEYSEYIQDASKDILYIFNQPVIVLCFLPCGYWIYIFQYV